MFNLPTVLTDWEELEHSFLLRKVPSYWGGLNEPSSTSSEYWDYQFPNGKAYIFQFLRVYSHVHRSVTLPTDSTQQGTAFNLQLCLHLVISLWYVTELTKPITNKLPVSCNIHVKPRSINWSLVLLYQREETRNCVSAWSRKINVLVVGFDTQNVGIFRIELDNTEKFVSW